MNIGRLVRLLSVVGLLVASSNAHADLRDELDKMFGSLTNVTSPGVYETQRRGVLAGGSIQTRARIMTPNIVSLVPPGVEAGCGGINLYGGAFSYINADEFVAFLRSVAANAKGYAFKLALDHYAPSIAQQMETAASVVRDFNRYFGNSCQMAQGLVNNTLNAMGAANRTDASNAGIFGGFGDVFESYRAPESAAPADVVEETLTGNLVWRGLKLHGAAGWFEYGNDNLLEAIMSLTGTIVVHPIAGEGPAPIDSMSKSLGLVELIEGGDNVMVLTCVDSKAVHGCRDVQPQMTSLEGLKDRLHEALLGGDTQVGIVPRLMLNQGLTPEERALIANLPMSMGGMIQNLSAFGGQYAVLFVEQSIGAIARTFAVELADDMLQSVMMARVRDHGYSPELADLLADTRDALRAEREETARKYGDPADFLKFYNDLVSAAQWRTQPLTARTRTAHE